eukprot:Plantae.Rhodophyta-Rhodochaete_pulchella.ctg25097.p1 GENE.Plantae.Rhodophyta-Rhodochaete_pulchella.ctg25097~~Plantae.Rhodophyta-Rhodochaete_pulchella.ctg25097.p1  ORF type:complete len:175 (+),score=28.51 Plantae.Rhodophyta-Rhodochaete_pulchella.ctg25097:59-526(+)
MYESVRTHSDLFDAKFVSKTAGMEHTEDVPVIPGDRVSLKDHQTFKYVVCVGSDHDWQQHLRLVLHLNSVVLRHESDAMEFFTPLLQPNVHYIPFKLDMSDLVSQTQWAVGHDEEVQGIVRNATEFAKTYLSTRRMIDYWYMAILKYAKLQSAAA